MSNPPKISINERAILVYLRVHMWNADQLSKNLSNKLCNSEGVEQDAASVIIHTLPKGSLDTIRTARYRIHSLWIKAALPYMDGGIRILPIVKLEQFKAQIDAAIAEYNTVVKSFLDNEYPQLCINHADRIQKLLAGKAMPTAQELAYRFSVSIRYMPLPKKEDIRYNITAGTNEALASQFDAGQQEILKQTMKTVWMKLGVMLEKIQTRLNDTNAVFRDSLIENLKEYCNDIPNLNLLDDQALENTRQLVMNTVAQMDPEDLRDNVNMRKSVAKKAKTLLENVTRKINLDLE